MYIEWHLHIYNEELENKGDDCSFPVVAFFFLYSNGDPAYVSPIYDIPEPAFSIIILYKRDSS